MGKLKFRFHPLFIIYFFLCLYFGWFNNVFYYVVTVVLHEYGHYFVAKKFGYNTDGILYSIYGAGLNTTSSYKKSDDIKISLAGPLVNLFLIVLIVCFWWLIPSIYYFTYDFLVSNFVIMTFNLIPIYPLDGGRIVLALLSNKIKRKKIIKMNNILCFSMGLFFIILFAISLFFKYNLSFLFIGLFLAINSILGDKGEYWDKVNAFNKSKNKPCEVKIFKVNSCDKRMLINCMSPSYYSIFLINGKSGNKIVKEDEIIQ